jgi:hypothetical protein
MTTFRYREEESSGGSALLIVAGALAGLAAGVLIAQRFGGVSAIAGRVRSRLGAGTGTETERWRDVEEDEYEEQDYADEGTYAAEGSELEERVLEAFINDPIMSERAVDIGALGEGIIELTGWVYTDDESDHAVTLTRGVPGVETVVNRLDVRAEEDEIEENRRRFESGDPALTEARWEGNRVGTGRRRQGTSQEPDRHADPKVNLEDKWLDEELAVRDAADDTEGLAERRKGNKKAAPKGDRTGGSPVAPTGVPKGDHVADPAEAQDLARTETGRGGDLTRRAD